jgi:hypothetical protein
MLHSPTSLRLEDLITAPAKAEFLLELLTPDQILAIEQTLGKVKKRRLNKSAKTAQNNNVTTMATSNPPTPTSTPVTTPVLKQSNNNSNNSTTSTPNEPVTEMRDGVEWVSFVYSHNRTLKRYSIRTDLQQIDISVIDDKFKSENCVYPRANLPKEEYHGNRWAYETECNVLGWKLAWLNKDEIAGKRGLIQRAVDSYRNRYPSMRSRRVARQEKLMNGTLRKRKHREGDAENDQDMSSLLSGVTIQSAHHPKTIAIEDANNQRFRIKINVESVDLEEINIEFRKANCPYPRVMNINQPTPLSSRWLEETMCNELAWKLAWLNPRHLAGKKNMLQRALDIYRSKFMPSLQPRKNSNRVAPIPPPSLTDTVSQQASLLDLLPSSNTIPLTADALSAQNALYEKASSDVVVVASPAMSNMSGTTESLDFADCFSLADEETKEDAAANAAAAAVFCDLLLQDSSVLFDNDSTRMNSTSSYSSDSTACTPSPTMPNDPFSADFFDNFIMSSSTTNDDPFYNMVIDNSTTTTTAADLSKLYNTTIEDTFTAGNLLDPLF